MVEFEAFKTDGLFGMLLAHADHRDLYPLRCTPMHAAAVCQHHLHSSCLCMLGQKAEFGRWCCEHACILSANQHELLQILTAQASQV